MPSCSATSRANAAASPERQEATSAPVRHGARQGPRLERHLTRAHGDPPAALHRTWTPVGPEAFPQASLLPRRRGYSALLGAGAIAPPGRQGRGRGQPSEDGQDDQADRGRPLADARRRRHRAEGGERGEPSPGVEAREPAHERDGAQPDGERDQAPRQRPGRRGPPRERRPPRRRQHLELDVPRAATARSARASPSPAPRRPPSGRRSRASPGCPPSPRPRARTGCAAA